MIRRGFLDSGSRKDLTELARDGSAAHRLAGRKTIEADVSPERRVRFLLKEENGYRVSSELRATVVFTVRDVLGDPPSYRIDLVSCRNLLIYPGVGLRPRSSRGFILRCVRADC